MTTEREARPVRFEHTTFGFEGRWSRGAESAAKTAFARRRRSASGTNRIPDAIESMDGLDRPDTFTLSHLHTLHQRWAFEIPGPDAKSLATVFIGSTRRDDSGRRRKPWAE